MYFSVSAEIRGGERGGEESENWGRRERGGRKKEKGWKEKVEEKETINYSKSKTKRAVIKTQLSENTPLQKHALMQSRSQTISMISYIYLHF